MTRPVKLDERSVEFLMERRQEPLKLLESLYSVGIHLRGNLLSVDGAEPDVAAVRKVLTDFSNMVGEGHTLDGDAVRRAFREMAENRGLTFQDFISAQTSIRSGNRVITPKTRNQSIYVNEILNSDLVVGIGPAGTGKTFLAVALAVAALLDKRVFKIVLTRPAVEAGEKLGFLPGDMQEKVNPYLRPLYDALHHMLDFEKVRKLIEKETIEIAPLAFMRGRTLSDAFIILDEAQNTTPEQMKMFLTRIGIGSKVVVTGDITQIDLPAGMTSGLVQAAEVLEGIPGIRFCYFSEKDVVRHALVQLIVRAYGRFNERRRQGRDMETGLEEGGGTHSPG